MINLNKYIPGKTLDLYRYYDVEGNFYYIENNLHKNNILQEPIVIKFNKLKINLAHVLFKDKEGNDYCILGNNIYDNEDEAKDKYLHEMKNYKNRIVKKNMYDWYDYEFLKESSVKSKTQETVIMSTKK